MKGKGYRGQNQERVEKEMREREGKEKRVEKGNRYMTSLKSTANNVFVKA